MKVTVVLGSPRPWSNSERLAMAAAAALTAAGGPPEVFRLNDLRYRGCQGCMACKTGTEYCVVKDDMARVLSSAAGSDFLILATPIYIGDISSQLKAFVDRTFSWYKPGFKDLGYRSRLAPGKKILLVVTQGNEDITLYKEVATFYLGHFETNGFEGASYRAAVGVEDIGALAPQLLESIAELALSL
ncbi:MAG: flavodoxin family protein [Deltaproteobacteria bacterium]|jgi:multimeric flavodoxin WrbA|nr:flavodoxin family protein [Deltaproteobacteria bacterium]